MIQRLLVANRGEIARRVFATCRRLGIETVAVHSESDAGLPFVREADVAVLLSGHTPAETYLRGDLVLDAARRAGADAVHPGYGFLSENAEFAQSVIEAGLTWVGPTPESIREMGSKIRAKELMRQAGVPVLEAPQQPTDADLPLLVKASAGGGGRGMRVVRSLVALPKEVAAAEAEAASAFGDGTVFVEPYVEHGRHVEVQVLGHSEGVLVLGERDCSLQRRHQKVVEEAPAPCLPDTTRAALHAAACSAAEAIGYRGAGTVEFLYDPEADRFFFLEMNTRLQVEHPVTEAVFGVDLVELQLVVAEGRVPGLAGSSATSAHDSQPVGHAIEVRLYAEDPAADYQPQSGTLHTLEVPGVDACFGALDAPGLRVDAGYESGDAVSTHYDAMLAKVICWAPTREQAARRLASALAKARIHGVPTNRDQLVAALRDEDFLAGRVGTDFLERRPALSASSAPDPVLLGFVAAVSLAERDRQSRARQQSVPVAWRNVVSQPQRTVLEVPGAEGDDLVAEWYGGRQGYRHAHRDDLVVVAASPTSVLCEVAGVRSRWDVRTVDDDGAARVLYLDGPDGSTTLREVPRFTDPADVVAQGSLLAPMPGTVIAVPAEEGSSVRAGQPVLVLEAMKMQHTISAPTDGVVGDLVAVGAQVAAGDVLAVVHPHPDPDRTDPARPEDHPREGDQQDRPAGGDQA